MTIEEAVSVYERYAEGLGYEDRRYGALIGVLNGVVAIADESGDNGSDLEMHTEVNFIQWMIEATDLLASGECDDMHEAVNETRPCSAVTDSH